MLRRQESPHVLLAEDRGVVRRGLELVMMSGGLRVVGAVDSDIEALEAVSRDRYDIVVMSVGFSRDCPRTVAAVQTRAPGLPVIVYGNAGRWPLQSLLDAGARGCALLGGSPEEFVTAVRTVADGCTYLDPALELGETRACDPLSVLSPREHQVMVLLAHGLTGAEVAGRLFLSPATVRTHVQNAMHKLGARTRAHAMAIATGGAETASVAA